MMIYASITYYFLLYVGHISLVPQFSLFGSGSVLPVLPTILMSASFYNEVATIHLIAKTDLW